MYRLGKILVFLFVAFTACESQPEFRLDTYILGEKFCNLDSVEVCVRFQADKGYYSVNGKEDLEGFPFKIIKTVKEENLILFEVIGEGIVNEIKVIHKDTITIKQRGLDSPFGKLYRVNQ